MRERSRWFRLLLAAATVAGTIAVSAYASSSEGADGSVAYADSLKQETIVVTASRKEQPLEDVPAAVTVLDSRQIIVTPADDMGDLLRGVPGTNVSQTSALDLSVTSRGATSTLPQGELVMVDHRSVYSDINNFVLWVSLPVELEEIDRIEVVRGPGSAVWGANATDGIVHIITQRPRDAVGTTLKVGGGELGSAFGTVVHSGATGKLGYRVSGGWITQDPYDQPTGIVPGTEGPSNGQQGIPYTDYENQGLDLWRGSFRLDYEPSASTTWSLSGGAAAYEGIFLNPAGPFRFNEGTCGGYGKLDFLHESTRVTFYTNSDRQRGEFVLLPPSDAGKGDLTVHNLDVSDTRLVGTQHIFTYGANVRYSIYNQVFLPTADNRDLYGAYLQDDIYLNDKLRLVAGTRWDNIDPMGNAFSPRASLLITPVEGHQFRLSYNRAFIAPSVVENHIFLVNETVITIPDGGGGEMDLLFQTVSKGNLDLTEERLDAFEVGWTGQVTDRARLSVAAYRNELTDAIASAVTEVYSSVNPPPGWPLPIELLDIPPPAGFAGIPSSIEQVNAGNLVNQGVEVTVDVRANRELALTANYSWQDVPEVDGFQTSPLPNGTMRPAINVPPRHRINAGAAWDNGQVYVNGNVNYQGEAFWADFYDPGGWGPTESFTMINAGAGVRVDGGRIVLTVNGQNVFDADVQQHVWGDFLGRKVTGQVVVRF